MALFVLSKVLRVKFIQDIQHIQVIQDIQLQKNVNSNNSNSDKDVRQWIFIQQQKSTVTKIMYFKYLYLRK